MYNSLRKISLFCLFMSIFHAVGAALLFFFLGSENLGFAFEFSIGVCLICGSAIHLFISIALRSLAQDLEIQTDYMMDEISSLKKNLETLKKQDY